MLVGQIHSFTRQTALAQNARRFNNFIARVLHLPTDRTGNLLQLYIIPFQDSVVFPQMTSR